MQTVIQSNSVCLVKSTAVYRYVNKHIHVRLRIHASMHPGVGAYIHLSYPSIRACIQIGKYLGRQAGGRAGWLAARQAGREVGR